MAGGVTAEVPTIKAIVKLLVINFIIKLYALKNNFEMNYVLTTRMPTILQCTKMQKEMNRRMLLMSNNTEKLLMCVLMIFNDFNF